MATERTVTVENTQDRVHCLADLKLRPRPTEIPPGTTLPPDDALLPGINEVFESEWLKAEKHPMVKLMLDRGELKVTKRPATIEALHPSAAADMVKRTFDQALLQRWLEGEKRKVVVDAISAQLAEITPKEKKAGEE